MRNAFDVEPYLVPLCVHVAHPACRTSASIDVTQAGFTGDFAVRTFCLKKVATETTKSPQGPHAVFKIDSGLKSGYCRFTFAGGGGRKGTANVVVSPNPYYTSMP